MARFAVMDEVTAYEKLVRAAVVAGLSGPPGVYFPGVEPVRAVADECVVGLLADLLDAGSSGVPAGMLVDSMAEFVEANFHGLPDLVVGLIPGWVRTQLERLEDLGVVTGAGENVRLTPAGVPVSVGLVEGFNSSNNDDRRGTSRGTNHRTAAVTRDIGREQKVQVYHRKASAITTSTGLRRRERRFESCREDHPVTSGYHSQLLFECPFWRPRGMGCGTNPFHETLDIDLARIRLDLARSVSATSA